MVNLNEILGNAQAGEAMAALARQFKLTEQQTEAAVDALLPAFSLGLKQMSATPGGFASLFGMMAQPNYQAMFESPQAPNQGQAGNDILGLMFGSPEVSRAVAEQAAQYAGIGSAIMKKMLPVVAAMVIGGMMRALGQGAAAGEQADMARTFEQAGRTGSDLFSQLLDAGREVQQAHLDNMQRVFDAFLKPQK
jgi:hypothetical protein